MTSYKHTQIGYLMLGTLCVIIVFFIWIHGTITAEASMPAPTIGIMVFVVFILASFGSLTVKVDDQHVRIKFGYGIFQKRFPLNEISSAKQVKNCWYYGWGIRLFFWPYMWIYNVSGFDAVELIMKNGKIYRIGTDDPNGLNTAIATRIM